MVDAQMAFPPGKKVFDVSSEFIGLSYLFGCQIPAICCYLVIDAGNMVSDQSLPVSVIVFYFDWCPAALVHRKKYSH